MRCCTSIIGGMLLTGLLSVTSFAIAFAWASLDDSQVAEGVVNAADEETGQPEVINSSLMSVLLSTSYDSGDSRATAGVYVVTASWTNDSSFTYSNVFAEVAILTNGAVLLNADSGTGGVGSTISADTGPDDVLSPGESFTQVFEIGLETPEPFEFFVNVFGTLDN